ncbi:MAG: orotidine-5'-phosphate decarboxylase [Nitrospirae bacterium]|nr:orotidine-5'-phosphate decarboxylase [Nitrospirota bacterium]MCL5422045.1 orotidine-5'-phosphate decarboxylase [Nitrospirota bacterium]
MPAKEKIILALDVSDVKYAIEIIDKFKDYVGIFKVGLEVFTAAGPAVVEEINRRDKKVFLDLKFHDISNTVIKAALNAVRLGAYMFNLHASGGLEMMRSCKEAVVDLCLRENIRKPKLLGVTVLTGLSQEVLKDELGIQHSLRTHVKQLSKLSAEAGLDGVVASGHEVAALRNHFGKNFLIVTPGIRTSWSPPDDQKRTMTPRQAIREGADYIVLGRAVMNQPDPFKALELITAEILTA